MYIITAAVSGALGSLQGTGGRYAQLIAPFQLLDGLRTWLLHGKEINTVAPAQSAYGIVALILVVVCVFALLRRYKKIAA
mgnify:CR=1 FL=1